MDAINYFNHALTRQLIHQFNRSIYVASCHKQTTNVSSTRCDHCQTCHRTISLAYRLKVITVVLQLQHNN